MTSETTVVETVTETPSKLAFLKSRITKEALIVGGIVTGIIIAGGLAILTSTSEESDDESNELDDVPFEPDTTIES